MRDQGTGTQTEERRAINAYMKNRSKKSTAGTRKQQPQLSEAKIFG